MLRFLLPLLVASTTDDLWRMAYVLAYKCGLLPAPLLGLLAKPYQLFRPVFFGGFMSMYVSLGTVRQASALGMWVALARWVASAWALLPPWLPCS